MIAGLVTGWLTVFTRGLIVFVGTTDYKVQRIIASDDVTAGEPT